MNALVQMYKTYDGVQIQVSFKVLSVTTTFAVLTLYRGKISCLDSITFKLDKTAEFLLDCSLIISLRHPPSSGVARVPCTLGQEIFLWPLSTKTIKFEVEKRSYNAGV